MPRIIYIHGFLSSSGSAKAQQTARWLQQHRSEIDYLCPDLSSYPGRALSCLNELLQSSLASDTFLIGSSLGGFWASYFVEQGRAAKAVLVNPAVSPHTRFADLVGQELKHYYSDEVCCLSEDDIATLASCEQPEIKNTNSLWLLAQKEDEVLDYRLAEHRYRHCKVTIEEGGDHSFVNYDRWLPDIIKFFEN